MLQILPRYSCDDLCGQRDKRRIRFDSGRTFASTRSEWARPRGSGVEERLAPASLREFLSLVGDRATNSAVLDREYLTSPPLSFSFLLLHPSWNAQYEANSRECAWNSSSRFHTSRNSITDPWSISIGLRTIEFAPRGNCDGRQCYDRRGWDDERCKRNNQYEVLRELLQAHLAAAAGASGERKVNFGVCLAVRFHVTRIVIATTPILKLWRSRKYVTRHVELIISIFCSRLHRWIAHCVDIYTIGHDDGRIQRMNRGKNKGWFCWSI